MYVFQKIVKVGLIRGVILFKEVLAGFAQKSRRKCNSEETHGTVNFLIKFHFFEEQSINVL